MKRREEEAVMGVMDGRWKQVIEERAFCVVLRKMGMN